MSRGMLFPRACAAWPVLGGSAAWPEAVLDRNICFDANIRNWFNTKELRWALVNVDNHGEFFVA